MMQDNITISGNGMAAAMAKPNLVPNAGDPVQKDGTQKVEIPHAQVKFDPAQQQQRLSQMMSEFNQAMRDMNRNLNFSFDASLNVQVVTVKNTNTGEVVRQIPSETVLNIAHNLDAIKGLLEDHKI